jgi:hypothetical protein
MWLTAGSFSLLGVLGMEEMIGHDKTALLDRARRLIYSLW